jgi:hypothetical protein
MRETLKTARAPAKAIIVVMTGLWLVVLALAIDQSNPVWHWLADTWLSLERLFRASR